MRRPWGGPEDLQLLGELVQLVRGFPGLLLLAGPRGRYGRGDDSAVALLLAGRGAGGRARLGDLLLPGAQPLLLRLGLVTRGEVLLGHGLGRLGAVLDCLEVLPKSVLSRRLEDGGWFPGAVVFLRRCVVITAAVLELLLLPLLGSLVLLNPVQVILQLYPHLPLCRLVPHKWMLEKLVSVGSLMIVLHQHGLYKVLELATPPL